MKPKEKGDIALGKAIAYFMGQGYEVCLPIGDKRDYDLVIEKQGVLSRVQVKYAGLYIGKTQCHAALRVMGGNRSYNSAKKYCDDSFEYLFVHTAKSESFLFPWNELKVRSELSVDAPQYRAYKVMLG